MKRTGSENQAHGNIVRPPVPFIFGHLSFLLLVQPGNQKLVQHLVFLEPGLHCHPGVARGVRALTLPVIGEEIMPCAWIDF
jgi:hypothetical protein